ncbi:MAG: calcium-binding protein [Acidimicrobiales bacterium]
MLVPVVVLAAVVAAFQAGPAPAQSMQCRGQSATIVGTPGNDRIKGTPGRDVIVTMGGNDRIKGLGGNDIICSGPGRDRIVGGGGNDYIAAGSGNDRVSAGAGRDVVNGGRGNDRLLGGGGNDSIEGGPGDDVMAGGGGNDRMNGGTGFDQCGPASIPGREPGGVFGPARAARACEVEEISLRQQTVRFAGQDWTILGAVASFESRFTFGDSAREPDITDERRLFLRVRITNRTSDTFVGSRHQVLLAVPGYPTVRSDSSLTSVSAGTAEEELLSFRVPDRADLNEAAVVLGSTNVEQQILPLLDSAPTERFPIAGSIDQSARTAATVRGLVDVQAQMISATWDLELGDHDPAGGAFDEAAYRALEGHRILRVAARYLSLDPRPAAILSSDVRVEIDGIPRAITAFDEPGGLLEPGSAVELVFAAQVPSDASQVSVLVGTPGGPTVAEFPVVVPDLSR